MSEGRSDDFQNTLRNTLLTLLVTVIFEIIPGPQTSTTEVLDSYYIWREILGKLQ
jgi:hypothetical protein